MRKFLECGGKRSATPLTLLECGGKRSATPLTLLECGGKRSATPLTLLECGGKRSATPLYTQKSGVAHWFPPHSRPITALQTDHRTPDRSPHSRIS